MKFESYVKGFFQFVGSIFLLAGLIFFFAESFIVSSSGRVEKDFLGLAIPVPPTWTSHVPYVGTFINYVFELFSLHGLIEIIILIGFMGIGSFLLKLGEKSDMNQKRQSQIEDEDSKEYRRGFRLNLEKKYPDRFNRQNRSEETKALFNSEK